MASTLAFLVTLLAYHGVSGWRTAKFSHKLRRAGCRMTSDISLGADNSEETALLREKVDYFDLNTPYLGITTPTTRSLPLFVLGNAFYPCGETILTVFEMKYRTMMFDIMNADDSFGYIHAHPQTGQLATYGTLCKVIDRRMLEDGRHLISVAGVDRFRLQRIDRTLPYVVGQVDTNAPDAPADTEDVIRLEKEVYNYLKFHMRLLRLTGAKNELAVQPAIKQYRPNSPGATFMDPADRRTKFSFALSNIIIMEDSVTSQLILQTTDIKKRLLLQRHYLREASSAIAHNLQEWKIITPEICQLIKVKSFNDDFDEDILPKDIIVTEDPKEKDEWDIQNTM